MEWKQDPSDLNDVRWQIIELLILLAKPSSRTREHEVCATPNSSLYVRARTAESKQNRSLLHPNHSDFSSIWGSEANCDSCIRVSFPYRETSLVNEICFPVRLNRWSPVDSGSSCNIHTALGECRIPSVSLVQHCKLATFSKDQREIVWVNVTRFMRKIDLYTFL